MSQRGCCWEGVSWTSGSIGALCHFYIPQTSLGGPGKLDHHSPFLEIQLLPELCAQAEMGQGLVTSAPCNRDAKGTELSLSYCFFINETENNVFENSKHIPESNILYANCNGRIKK